MKLQYKAWAIMAGVILPTVAAFSLLTLHLRRNAVLREADAKLWVAAHAAKHMLPPDYHDKILDPTSVPAAQFEQSVDNNNKLCLASGLQYVWSVLVQDPQHIVFTSATSPDHHHENHLHAKFYELHTDPAAFAEALQTLAPCFSTFRNKWGSGRMVLIPERDHRGRVYMFGASVAVAELDTILQRTMADSLGIGLLVAGVALLIAFRFAKSVAAPLVRLTQAAESMARGDLDVELAGAGKGEIAGLARAFDTMRKIIREKMKGLRASEERYRGVVEDQTEIICRFRTDETIIFVNDVYGRFFGKAVQELIGKKWAPMVVPEDLPHIEEELRRLAPSHPVVLIENRVHSGTGQVRWMQFVNRGFFDSEGRLVEVQSVGRDITERKQAEAARQQSEQYLRTLVETVPDVIYIIAPDGTLLSLNPTFEKVTGWTCAEWLGKLFTPLVHPEDVPHAWESMQRALRGENAPPYELRIRTQAGAYIVGEFVTTALVEHGQIVGVLGIGRDITARKQAEETLRRSERRFSALVEHAADAVALLGPDGTFIYASPAAARINGYPPEAFLGQNAFQIIHPEDAPRMRQEFQRILQEPRARIALKLRLRHQNGAWRWIEGVATNLVADPAISAIVVNYRDITERYRAEEQLRKLSLAVEQSPACVVITDTTGAIEYVNPKFTQLTGYSFRKVLGQNPRILKSGEHPAEFYQQLWQTITAGGEWRGEFHNRKENGELYWEAAVISPICDASGKIMQYLAVKEDITARKQMEAALRATQERLRFLLEASPAVIYAAQAVSPYAATFVSENVTAQLGYEPKAFLGDPGFWATHIHPDDAPQIFAEMPRLFEAGRHSHEYRFQHSNGSYRWMHDEMRLIRDAAGQPAEVVGYWIDITGRRQIEDELRHSEADLAEAQRAAMLGSWRYDAANNSTRWSDELYQIFDIEKANFADTYDSFLSCVHPDDRPRIMQIRAETMATGKSFELEHRVQTRTGEVKIIRATGYAVKDFTGKIVGLFGTAQDITIRKQTEEKLQQSEQKFRSYIEKAPMAVFVSDLAGRFVDGNPAATTLLGYDTATLKTMTARELHPADEDAAVQQAWAQLRCQGEVHGEFRMRRKDGQIIWVALNAVRMGENRVLGYCRDITARKQAERQLRSSEAQLRALAARLQGIREEERAHIAREVHDELGQALTVLKMDLTRLSRQLDGANRAQATAMLQTIDTTVQAVRRIATALRPAVLDDLGLVAALDWQARDFQQRTGIACACALPENEPALAPHQATALFRIFQEVLTNVARHAGASRVEVCLRVVADGLQLELRDNGRGITAAELAQPQALGILGMRERARLAGGDLEISGTPGVGTQLTVRVPLQQK